MDSVQVYLELGTHDIRIRVVAGDTGATCPVVLLRGVAVIRVPNRQIGCAINAHQGMVLASLKRVYGVDNLHLMVNESDPSVRLHKPVCIQAD